MEEAPLPLRDLAVLKKRRGVVHIVYEYTNGGGSSLNVWGYHADDGAKAAKTSWGTDVHVGTRKCGSLDLAVGKPRVGARNLTHRSH